MTDVNLISMPYRWPAFAVLSLSSLCASAKAEGISIKAKYPMLWFVEKVGMGMYRELCGDKFFIGEWTFSGAAFPGFDPDHDALLSAFADPGEYEELWKIRRLAEEFVDEAAEKILESEPRIVGCTLWTGQQCASLALLRKIKELKPETITMLGGDCCKGIMGRVNQQAFEQVDFVFSGEADITFPKFCKTLLEKGKAINKEDVPEGVISDFFPNDAIPPISMVSELDKLPIPDFDDYFQAFDDFSHQGAVRPWLGIETSRGCWWGEKSGCAFCGKVGCRSVAFRTKSGDRVFEELNFMRNHYPSNKFLASDSIFPPNYFKTLLPRLSEQESQSLIFYHINPKMSERWVKLLSGSGMRWVQAGIEGLHDEMLSLMNKSNSAMDNVTFLKYAIENGIRVFWYYLKEAPGDQDIWYQETASWVPLVFHLEPPTEIVTIQYERFSRYHQNPEKFGLSLIPGRPYSSLFPLSPEELKDFVFYFEDENKIAREHSQKPGFSLLEDRLGEWSDLFGVDSGNSEIPKLVMAEHEDHTVITDTRPCAVAKEFVLEGAPRMVNRICRKPRSRDSILKKFQSEMKTGADSSVIDEAIDFLTGKKLLLQLNGRLLSLATYEPERPLLTLKDFFGKGI